MPFIWLVPLVIAVPLAYKISVIGAIWAIFMWFFMLSMAAVAGQRRELIAWSLASLPIVLSGVIFVWHTPSGPMDVFGRAFVLGSIIFFAALVQRSESVYIKYGMLPYFPFLGICVSHAIALSIFLLFGFFKLKLMFLLHAGLLPVAFYMIKAMNLEEKKRPWTLPVISAETVLVFLAIFMIFLGLSSEFINTVDIFLSKILGV